MSTRPTPVPESEAQNKLRCAELKSRAARVFFAMAAELSEMAFSSDRLQLVKLIEDECSEWRRVFATPAQMPS